MIGSCWPIAVVLIASAASVSYELARDRWMDSTPVVYPRGVSAAVRFGLKRILPFTLLLTFLLVPSASTRIFKTFLCDRFEYDGANGVTRSYLHDALELRCDSDEYYSTRSTAILFAAVWPVGVPVMYALLLWASRDGIRSGIPTPLCSATAFLWADCISAGNRTMVRLQVQSFDRCSNPPCAKKDEKTSFWWEPLEMCRKLTLSISAVAQTAVLALASG